MDDGVTWECPYRGRERWCDGCRRTDGRKYRDAIRQRVGPAVGLDFACPHGRPWIDGPLPPPAARTPPASPPRGGGDRCRYLQTCCGGRTTCGLDGRDGPDCTACTIRPTA